MENRRGTGRRARPRPELTALGGRRVVRVAELERLGLDRRTIAYRCRPGGPWSRLGPGVVKLDNGPRTRDDHRRAALLHAGPAAVLTGLDALALHGVRAVPAAHGPVHVLVPPERRRVGAGLVLAERTHRLPRPGSGDLPLAPVARAALDACRRSRDRNLVRAVLADVVQQRHCTVEQLVRELADGSSRGSALPREVVGEVVGGVRSVAEADARLLLRRSGLPEPLLNVRIEDLDGTFVAVPDFYFDDVGLGWQIESVEFHLSPGDYERTIRRRSAMVARGIVVVQTLPRDLRHRRDEVLEELRHAYAQAALLPAPPVVLVREDAGSRTALWTPRTGPS